MSNIDALIEGSDKLTDIFGYWPSFHDAEVIESHFWRGDVEPEAKRYIFPVLTVKLHVWELTREVDSKGYFILRNHTLTTLRFHDIREFSMDGFNQQNVILDLSITHQERSESPLPFFEVHFDSALGMDAKFECSRIEVLDAMRCTPDGKGPS